MYQLRAFICWMFSKACLLPARLVKCIVNGLDYLATAVYEDGFIGVMLSALISGLGFMLGFIVGGIYLECTKTEDTIVHVGQVATFGLYSFIVTATTIFFYICWYCFRKEQDELIKQLKEKYHD